MSKRLLGIGACLCVMAGTLQAQAKIDRLRREGAAQALQAYDKAIVSLAAVVKIDAGGGALGLARAQDAVRGPQ